MNVYLQICICIAFKANNISILTAFVTAYKFQASISFCFLFFCEKIISVFKILKDTFSTFFNQMYYLYISS